MADDSKTERLDFCRTRHTQDDADRKEAHSGGLGNAALVSVPNGVPKKRKNDYEQP
jgi:hypothetical protein